MINVNRHKKMNSIGLVVLAFIGYQTDKQAKFINALFVIYSVIKNILFFIYFRADGAICKHNLSTFFIRATFLNLIDLNQFLGFM